MPLCQQWQTSVVSPKGMVNPSRVLSSKSRVKRAKGNISNSRQKSQLKETTRRPKTVPSNVIHPNEKINSTQGLEEIGYQLLRMSFLK